MKVSVCVLTYNQEDYIKDTLEGILSQKTDFNFEIIIGEDRSSDETLNICLDYEKKYPSIIKVLKRKDNLGLLKNFSETIKHCQGEYIAYCEGDDYWIDKNKLNLQTAILCNESDVSLVHTNWKDFIAKENRIIDKARMFKGVCVSETIKNNEGVAAFLQDEYGGVRGSSIMFRYKDVNEIIDDNFDFFNDPDMKTFDYFLFGEFAFRGYFRFLDIDATVYRILEESVSITSSEPKKAAYHFGVFKSGLLLIKKYNLKDVFKDYANFNIGISLDYSFRTKNLNLLKKIDEIVNDSQIEMKITHKIFRFGIKYCYNLMIIIYKVKMLISK